MVTAHDTNDEGVTIGPVFGLWVGVLYTYGAHGNVRVVDRSTASVTDLRGVGILLLAGGALEHRVVGARGGSIPILTGWAFTDMLRGCSVARFAQS